MKIKTSELINKALDWAVQEIEYQRWIEQGSHVKAWALEDHRAGRTTTPYSSDWLHGGPIIEREGINLDNYGKNPSWSAWTPAPDRDSGEAQAYGPTALIAAMRCYVASKLGDEVDIPDELLH